MARQKIQAPDDLMDTQETAELLRTSANGLYVLRSRAEKEGDPNLAPPAYRIGSRLLFSKGEVLRWLAGLQREDLSATQSADSAPRI